MTIPVRSWVAAAAAALITGGVATGLTQPSLTISGTDPFPAPSPSLPAPLDPSPTQPAFPAAQRGTPGPPATPQPLETTTRNEDAEPLELTIASLSLAMPIAAVGVQPDGQMEVPSDPGTAGWYRYGAGPTGSKGAVVIAAHVDSRQFGIGPFADLRELRSGAVVTLRAETASIDYRVEAVHTVDKNDLPPAMVFDRNGPPRLHLVTCGGSFTPGFGWDSNLIVVASRNN